MILAPATPPNVCMWGATTPHAFWYCGYSVVLSVFLIFSRGTRPLTESTSFCNSPGFYSALLTPLATGFITAWITVSAVPPAPRP